MNTKEYYRVVTNLLICLFAFTEFGFSNQSDVTIKSKQTVLYISSYHIGYDWADQITEGVRNILDNREDIILLIEYLDSKRFNPDQYFDSFHNYLQKKYANRSIDAVVVSDNDALDFAFKYYSSLFHNKPIAFCGINNPEDYLLENSNFYGVLESYYADSLIILISDLFPKRKNILFLMDNTTTGKVIKKQFQDINPEFPDLHFEFLDKVDKPYIKEKIKNLGSTDISYQIGINIDSDGNPVNSSELAIELAKASAAPYFTDDSEIIGTSATIGGILSSGVLQGEEAANLALQLLKNDSAHNIKHVNLTQCIYCFDYDILKKFNINEDALPGGSILINKPEPITRIAVVYIVLTTVFILFLLFIIFLLWFNINRRRKAEKMLRLKIDEVQDKNIEMNEINLKLENVNKSLIETNIELEEEKIKSVESDRLKSAFLANMSHEIRTPLNAIMGFSTLLNEESYSSKERQRYAEMVTSNSSHLLHLINDILDLSRSESEELEILNESFSAVNILQELVDVFKKGNKNSHIEIRFNNTYVDKNIILNSDPIRFRQVLSNLISNAVKFTEKGFVEVGFYSQNADITFYVKDTGIGIEEKNQAKIFERFWRIEDYSSKLFPGTGLGLSIAEKISDRLKGKLWFDSKIGIGSTFYFSLKGYSIEETGGTEEVKENEPKPLIKIKGKKIAIVEDESYNRQLLGLILESSNLGISHFNNGKEIVEYVCNAEVLDINLILMDLKMPKMDGYEATQIIKNKNPEIPIIAQTAHALPADIKKIKAHKFDDFITKPIIPNDLINLIKKHLL